MEDSHLCFRMKSKFKGYHVDPEFTVKNETNSKGLRDREIDYQRKLCIMRILALGDSFTFGNGVEAHESYPKALERLFNKGPIVAEVINAGVNGYGTYNELVYLKQEGYKYRPDIILLGFHVNNDIHDNLYPCKVDVVDGYLIHKAEPSQSAAEWKKKIRKIIIRAKIIIRTNFHWYRFLGDKYHSLLNRIDKKKRKFPFAVYEKKHQYLSKRAGKNISIYSV